MKIKQTAVEFLLGKIYLISSQDYDNIIQQAKAMEKEQIKDAFDAGYFNYEVLFYDNAEQYYNETYGTN